MREQPDHDTLDTAHPITRHPNWARLMDLVLDEPDDAGEPTETDDEAAA